MRSPQAANVKHVAMTSVRDLPDLFSSSTYRDAPSMIYLLACFPLIQDRSTVPLTQSNQTQLMVAVFQCSQSDTRVGTKNPMATSTEIPPLQAPESEGSKKL